MKTFSNLGASFPRQKTWRSFCFGSLVEPGSTTLEVTTYQRGLLAVLRAEPPLPPNLATLRGKLNVAISLGRCAAAAPVCCKWQRGYGP